MRQWMMRITAYADRLLDGLDTIDWTESLKEQQRNWIGRSVGAMVKFGVEGYPDQHIEVFTTRVDTIYGVTFMVLAPEHELVNQITPKLRNRKSRTTSRAPRTAPSSIGCLTSRPFPVLSPAPTPSTPSTSKQVPDLDCRLRAGGLRYGRGDGRTLGRPARLEFCHAFRAAHRADSGWTAKPRTEPAATKEGQYINSGIINGLTYAEATPVLIQWMEERSIGKGKTQLPTPRRHLRPPALLGRTHPDLLQRETAAAPYLMPEADLPLELPAESTSTSPPKPASRPWAAPKTGSTRESTSTN